MTKFEQALETCEKILTGIEMGTLTTSSMLMMCLRVARLTNDTDAIEWLQYENRGYPRDKDGHVLSEAWNIAYQRGRGSYNKDKKKVVFTILASELEGRILSQRTALNNFTTSGVSVSGDYATVAMSTLTRIVSNST